MMKWTLIPLVWMLTACNPAPPVQPKTEHAKAEHGPNPVFETQIQAIEKAKAVEGQVRDAAEAQRKQMDAAEQQ